MKPSYGILSRSVYSMAISHGSSCSRDPPILPMPARAIPSPTPPPIPSSSPTVSVRMPEFRYLLPCVPTIFRINHECRSVTFFFATRVVREKLNVGSECAQLTNHSVGRQMYYIDEASGGVSRERDSQVTGFHSSHTPPVICGLARNGMSGSLFV